MEQATMTIQDLAESTRQQFERRARASGDVFYARKDSAPAWVADLCHDAHRYGSGPDQDMSPDDVRYAFIVEALDALVESDNAADARDSLEPSIYNHELWAWLGSHGLRYSHIDNVLEEWGPFTVTDSNEFVTLVQRAQLAEKLEVFDSVLSSLETRLREQEGE